MLTSISRFLAMRTAALGPLLLCLFLIAFSAPALAATANETAPAPAPVAQPTTVQHYAPFVPAGQSGKRGLQYLPSSAILNPGEQQPYEHGSFLIIWAIGITVAALVLAGIWKYRSRHL